MDALVDLERRSTQIEGLAAALSAAFVARDIEHASCHLQRLREEVGLTEISIAALKARECSMVPRASFGSDVALSNDAPRTNAPASPASTAADHSNEQPTLESRERALSERLAAVSVQLGTLKQALESTHVGALVGGAVGVHEIIRFLYERLGRINAAWLWGKRTDRVGALSYALTTLRSVGLHRSVLGFLDDASRLESSDVREACTLLAALLELNQEGRS